MSDYLSELRRAIKAVHGCDARHVEAVPVKEVFRGETAWEGLVEVFDITGHRKARQCFAWGVRRDDDKGWDVTAVLAIPPVISAQTAVQVAIAAYAHAQKTTRQSIS